ncbi:hypothetical protein A1Q_4824 [Vibrio campbellii HY01]|nr:hypothetical protein A1Q_4824 [Vibrio campbellii HY01]
MIGDTIDKTVEFYAIGNISLILLAWISLYEISKQVSH